MDVPGLLAGASLISRPAEEFENEVSVEAMWAQKAFDYSAVHFNLICSVDPKYLTLTNIDNVLYKVFRDDFPKMRIDIVNEDDMKSVHGKEKWRSFINKLKDKIEDFSFGTLLRVNCDDQYTDSNTILSTRIQFFAIEVARNREGLNDQLKNKFRPSPETSNDDGNGS